MGEMKNLQSGDRGWNFLERIRQHNEFLERKEGKLWSLMPVWRKLLWFVRFRRQGWNWFYKNRWRLSYIDDDLVVHEEPMR